MGTSRDVGGVGGNVVKIPASLSQCFIAQYLLGVINDQIAKLLESTNNAGEIGLGRRRGMFSFSLGLRV